MLRVWMSKSENCWVSEEGNFLLAPVIADCMKWPSDCHCCGGWPGGQAPGTDRAAGAGGVPEPKELLGRRTPLKGGGGGAL